MQIICRGQHDSSSKLPASVSMIDKVYCASCWSSECLHDGQDILHLLQLKTDPCSYHSLCTAAALEKCLSARACMNETFVSSVVRFLFSRWCIYARLFRISSANITCDSVSPQAVEPKARRTLVSKKKARIGSHDLKHLRLSPSHLMLAQHFQWTIHDMLLESEILNRRSS